MRKDFWKQLNSPIVVWFLSTVVIGSIAFLFESYTHNRDRSNQLRSRLEQLGFEYAGRLSQYSEWFIYLFENPDNLRDPKMQQCVSPAIIKASIRDFASIPGSGTALHYSSRSSCEVPFSYGAIFAEFSSRSTLSLLAEMRLLHDEMQTRGEGRIAKPVVTECTYGPTDLSQRLTIAINSFLNPDTIIPIEVMDMATMPIEKLRKNFMCSFYGIGPDDLWYTDVFAG